MHHMCINKIVYKASLDFAVVASEQLLVETRSIAI